MRPRAPRLIAAAAIGWPLCFVACGPLSTRYDDERDGSRDDGDAAERLARGWSMRLGEGDLAFVEAAFDAPGGGLLLAGNGTDASHLLGETYPTGVWAGLLRPPLRMEWALLLGSWEASMRDAAPAGDGGLFVTGSVAERGGASSDVLALRLSASGELLWQVAAGESERQEEGLAILTTPEGGCRILARLGPVSRSELWLLELSSEGALVDSGDVLTGGYPVDLVEIGDGLVAIGRSSPARVVLVRLGSDRVVRWARGYALSRRGHVSRFVASPGGGLVGAGVVGAADDDAQTDLLVVGFDRSGALLWDRVIDVGPRDDVRDLEATPSGVVVVGSADGTGRLRSIVARLAWDGDLLSTESITEEWRVGAAVVTRDGELVVAGDDHAYGTAVHHVASVGTECQPTAPVERASSSGVVAEADLATSEPRPVVATLRETALEPAPWQTGSTLVCGAGP